MSGILAAVIQSQVSKMVQPISVSENLDVRVPLGHA